MNSNISYLKLHQMLLHEDISQGFPSDPTIISRVPIDQLLGAIPAVDAKNHLHPLQNSSPFTHDLFINEIGLRMRRNTLNTP